MKTNFTKIIVIGLLSIFTLDLSAKTTINNFNPNPSSEKLANACGVHEGQIIEYFAGFGIQVTQIINITGSCDSKVRSATGKWYIVHVLDGQIVGHDDIPL
ncbi:MAG: hypothetical protein ACRCYO_09445 [Bacteroidia bacterium]